MPETTPDYENSPVLTAEAIRNLDSAPKPISHSVTRVGSPFVSNYQEPRAQSVPAIDVQKTITALEAVKKLRASKFHT